MAISKLFIRVLLFFIFCGIAHATVCRLPGLNGFNESQIRGEKFIRSTTSNLKDVSLYIELTENGPWYHSNYITPGFEHPTKIGREDIYDAQRAYNNIAITQEILDKDSSIIGRLEKAYEENSTIYVDQSVLNSDGTSKIDFGRAKNLIAVDGKTGKQLSEIVKIDRTLGRKTLLTGRALGCCFFVFPPHFLKTLVAQLRSKLFNSKNVNIVSLVKDSATARAFKESKFLSKNVKQPDGLETKVALRNQIKDSRGKTLIVVGHVEGKKFVTRDEAGNMVFDYDVADLHTLAKKNNVQLIALGCETAKNVDLATTGSGVVKKFNTVDAVSNLEAAFSSSKNYAEFFENLTSPDLMFVAGETFLSKSPEAIAKVSIFSRIKGSVSKRIQVGAAYLLGRGSKINFSKPTKMVAGQELTESERLKIILEKLTGETR
ncbi:hypothetical protein [Thalassomonas sp. RHCl1]|uniref:hypothetical protein n=1 Tax=Thalassomonas sp. RHCl1 TaxID=2995320 RepID=UPI00248B5945|nr:hypothetical protein [Thalassomonas sp. RHCl1]